MRWLWSRRRAMSDFVMIYQQKKWPPLTSTAFDVYICLVHCFGIVIVEAHMLDAAILVHHAEGGEFADRRYVPAQIKARRLRIPLRHVELRRFARIPDAPFFALKLACADLKGDYLRRCCARVDPDPPPAFGGLRQGGCLRRRFILRLIGRRRRRCSIGRAGSAGVSRGRSRLL